MSSHPGSYREIGTTFAFATNIIQTGDISVMTWRSKSSRGGRRGGIGTSSGEEATSTPGSKLTDLTFQSNIPIGVTTDRRVEKWRPWVVELLRLGAGWDGEGKAWIFWSVITSSLEGPACVNGWLRPGIFLNKLFDWGAKRSFKDSLRKDILKFVDTDSNIIGKLSG